MGALRKAGVWLGLVEEVDERFDLDDEFADEDDFAQPARPRTLGRSSGREPPADYHNDGRGRPASGDRDAVRRETTGRRLGEPRRAEPRESPGAESQRGFEPTATDARVPSSRPEREPWTSERSGRGAEPTHESYDRPRADELLGDHGRVRQLSRTMPPGDHVEFPTHDNLALAPQVQLRQRAVLSEEKSRRYKITTLHPTTYNEARAIGEHFRDGYPVIINLTELDEPDAKRLVDFAAGLAFGLRGSMERVTNRVFLLSPPNIQVSAEDKAKIAENGFFDQG
jgi:cell division inhibitor SepF